MDIRHYTIAYDVDPVQQSISGTVEIDLVLSEPTPVLLFDFWKGSLELKKVMVNGKQQQFTHENDLIRVSANSTFSGKIKARIYNKWQTSRGHSSTMDWWISMGERWTGKSMDCDHLPG